MDGNPTKYFWAEPDGGADLRLSLPLDCFWEAPGYNSGITVRLSQEGASVRRLTTVRFLEFEARFRRAFLPAVSDEQFCGHCVTEELWHAFSCRLCPFLEGEAAEQACTISVSANFIASISGRPPRPIRELPTSINSIRSTASSPSRPPFSGAQGTSTLWTPILNGPTSSPMSLSWAPISSQRPLSKTGVRPEKGLFLLYAGSVWGILGPKELQRILS